MKGHFEFVITAEDAVGHIDAAKVQIYLLREDQRVRFVVRSQPKEIRARIEDFRTVLSNITDLIGKNYNRTYLDNIIAILRPCM